MAVFLELRICGHRDTRIPQELMFLRVGNPYPAYLQQSLLSSESGFLLRSSHSNVVLDSTCTSTRREGEIQRLRFKCVLKAAAASTCTLDPEGKQNSNFPGAQELLSPLQLHVPGFTLLHTQSSCGNFLQPVHGRCLHISTADDFVIGRCKTFLPRKELWTRFRRITSSWKVKSGHPEMCLEEEQLGVFVFCLLSSEMVLKCQTGQCQNNFSPLLTEETLPRAWDAWRILERICLGGLPKVCIQVCGNNDCCHQHEGSSHKKNASAPSWMSGGRQKAANSTRGE
ncbi:uncharacterized protein [Aphelocoma coerulescens]|uniref:uncharacterized protein n=1 Tax=Aphelocoma coerulescens TaxID=39617 RepID=UPI00360486E3